MKPLPPSRRPHGPRAPFFLPRLPAAFTLLLLLPFLFCLRSEAATVTNSNDSGAGSLRQAITDAVSGNAIVFDPALNGQTLTLTSGQFLLSKNLTFDASALPAGFTISGNNASRIFYIAAGNTVTLKGLTLANGQSSDYGGAIFNQGTLTLDTMTLRGNQTTYRGGAIINEGTLTLQRSTLHDNTSGGMGGAITSNGSLTVNNCTFTRNRSLGTFDPGGGSGRGGAIFNFGSMVLTHCTLVENSSPNQGGGIDTQGGTVTLVNSIIARNSSPIGADFRNGTTLTLLGRNLIGDNSSVEAQFPAGPLAGTTANPLDPKLSALGYYGGPTQTMPPLAGSPAIDPAGGATSSGFATDQRGETRVLDGNNPPDGTATVDVGAVEFRPRLAFVFANITINEDTPTGPVPLTVGTVGTLSAVSSNLTLVPNGNITLGGSGSSRTVSITPALDQNGTTTITVTDSISGESSAFQLTVLPLNDAPRFTKGADQTASASGARSIPGWATAISPGPADESGQIINFITTNSNNALFIQQPAVQTDGTLTYEPNLTVSGVATVSVRLQDDGSALSGHVNTSAIQTFTINVVAPVYSLGDSGAGSLRQTIADIEPGGTITFNPTLNGQTLTLTSGQFLLSKNLTFDASALPAGFTISGNNASRIFYIAAGNTVTLKGLTLANGQSSDYGGAIFNQGTLTLEAMTFDGNHVSQQGGAVYNEGSLTIHRSTFSGNTAATVGGAICNLGSLTIAHSTFNGNQAGGAPGTGQGGAILSANGFSNATLVLTHCTLTGNTASVWGGGLRTQSGTNTIENTLIANNAAPTSRDFSNGGGTVTVLGRNLIGDNSSVEAHFPVGPLAGTAANPLDPKLSALGYYGGPTQTMHPLIGSPAIDPAGGATSSAHATDQRGFPRVIDGGRTTGSAIADLGAVEAGPVLVVTAAGDYVAGSLRTQLATAAAAVIRGYHIVFDPAVFPATITHNGGFFTIQDSEVFIDASDIGGSGVQISGGGINWVFRVESSATVAMHSLTIRDGTRGIDSIGDLTLVKCTVANNFAPDFAGGIKVESSLPDIARAVLDHCTVAGNATTTGARLDLDSGGILVFFGELRLTHTTVSSNQGFASAGGIRLFNSKLILENSIVAGNLAGNFPDLRGFGVIQKGTNLIGSSSGNGLTGPLVGVDAKLRSLGPFNGGPTYTMPPRIGSPAINAATGPLSSATDQRGAPRKTGPASDLGAVEALIDTLSPAPNSGFANPQPITWTGAAGAIFEVRFGTAAQGLLIRGVQTSPFIPSPPLDFDTDYLLRIRTTVGGVVDAGETVTFSTRPLNPVVTTLTDDNNGLDSSGISLREAIAVVTDGETITFSPNLDGGTITLGGSELLIDDDITIDGSTLAAGITVSGGNLSRVFNIAAGTTTTLDALTITGGVPASGDGGGILNNGILTLKNSTVSGNEVSTGGSGFGGGIATTAGGRLVTANCTITGNMAANGGGIYSFSGGSGTSVLESTTITDNTASNGGGMRLISPVRFTNSVVSGNSASGSGPDALNSSPSATGVNLIGNLAGSGLSAGPTVIVGAPLLAPLGFYGGPTKTMPPLSGSPAINAGGATDLLTDQRGYPRVIGGTVDIGAVESGSAIFNPAGLTLTTWGPATLTSLEISTDPDFLNTVGTLAGTGGTVFANGPRDTATFNHPSGVAEDEDGNLYVADTGNQRIRRIDKLTGEVSTIAGTGAFGFADGNGLTTARFAFPAAVAVTADGGIVYVSDTINHRIRKLTKPAVIGQPWTVTTLAGTGFAGLTEGPGSIARFNRPHGLVIDGDGDLLVADTANSRIRHVTAAGLVSTYVSSPGNIDSPTGLALDSAGNLFVAEPGYNLGFNLIWKIYHVGLAVTQYAGFGQGFQDSPPRFNQPVALAIDEDDNLYVSDQDNHAIRKITSAGVVTTVAPQGVAPVPSPGFAEGNSTAARFDGPSGLLVDSAGFLIVADTGNHRLRRVSIEPLTVPTTHETGAGLGTLTAVINATALGLNPGQTYYFRWLPEGGGTEVAGTSFQLLLPPTVVTTPATSLSSTGGQLNATVNPQGSHTAVTFEYSTDPALRGPWQVSTLPPGSLTDPQGVAVFNGITYVADQASNAIYKVDALGVATLFAGAANGAPGYADGDSTDARFDSPSGIAVDPDGYLYVADRLNHRIREITPGGVVSTYAGSGLAGFADGPSGSARFLFPQGVAVSIGNVYVADTNNHRIRRIDKSNGAVTTLAGNGSAGFADGAGGSARFSSPRAVAVNSAGLVHVADTGNHAIRLLTADNSVVTLAGDGTAGFLDGSGTGTRFDSPAGLTIDGDGTIYIADQENHRVRSITPGGIVGTVAGSGVAGLLDSPVNSLHPATVAKLDGPGGIALDAGGNLIISEETGNRLRRIDRALLPTLATNPNLTGSGATSVFSVIDRPLLPGATYYFRAVANNARDTVEGGILSFTTPQSNIVVHNGPSDASPLLVPGQLVDFGSVPFDTPMVRRFTMKNIGNFSLSVTGVTLTGSPAGVFSLSGQTGASVIAAGATGTFDVTLDHGSAGTFTKTVSIASNDLDQPAIEFSITGTVLAPPLLTDVGASNLTALGVTFAGTVNPQGSATEVLFEYSKYPDFAGALEVLTTSGSVQGLANGCGGAAQFDSPSGVAIDRFGNIYVADTGNHLIRRISANGDCTVLAGSGVAGSADAAGILASFNAPEGVAVDTAGNVYVADTGNHRIRRITQAGVVTTLAGSGSTGAFTDGALGGARFNAPAGIAIDATGNLFIADTGNNRIRQISPAGEVSTLVGPAGYNSPKGIAVDRDGSLCVADTGNHRIVRFTATVPQITTGFSAPTGVAFDAAGLIHIADRGAHRIARIDSGGAVTTLAGTPGVSGANDGSGAEAKFNLPTGIAVSPSGTIYVADFNNHRIRQINLAARRVVAATNLLTAPEAPVTLSLVGLEPSTTYYYRGIASNGGGTVFTDPIAPAPLTFTTLDNNAGLLELTLNGIPVPNFSPCTYSYPVTVEPPQSAMVILAESDSPNALIQLFRNGVLFGELESGVPSAPLPLVAGVNPFQVTVISADGTNTRTYSVAATFVQPDSGFAQWQALKFGGDASNPLIAGELADPDHDSSVNLLEYAFDLDPNLSSPVGLPVMDRTGGFLTLTYRRRVGATDLNYIVQWSTDLIDWNEAGVIEELATPQGAGLTEEIRGKIPDTGPRKFLRVSVQLD